ncbi:VCBS repeat protein [Thermoflavifilum aggregans]|uniref:VCBS repeat protein n=1 Tax=Thermoflavifilum aggregans TaxID=454188 RepID=A0A2M9CTZ8_9BACT|nr:VCBS repeat-containing protein [Thermoflavifilum aggregans]PJJ75397.1 VCBS repeat protein [Thermoflavifilum aggregans]
MQYRFYHIFICLLSILSACSHPSRKTLFKLLPASLTGVDFRNDLHEDSLHNILEYEYFYNGGGVAIGDLNNDGLPDIYFTSNRGPDKLYLNEGHMHFRDITKEAGVEGRTGGWKTGVTMVDVNGDGLLDIYVCYSGNVDGKMRENQLFINQGIDKNGLPHFREEASQYGLADSGYSTQAIFFDMDHDGDLDCLVLNHNIKTFTIQQLLQERNQVDPNAGNHLYENVNGHYIDLTAKEGIVSNPIGFGLGVAVSDVNGDGWDDIYVSNDYNEKDYLYINDGTGKHFHDEILSRLAHMSYYSMGCDIADVNNDGFPDILTLDMLPPDNKRQKLLYTPDNRALHRWMVQNGFGEQIMRNMLQLNNGDGTFTETGQLAGISNTDWSWSPLIADFDNDGWKDIFITNGYKRDNTNMDYQVFRNDYILNQLLNRKRINNLDLLQKMPSTPLHNYIFRNNHHLQFIDESSSWGFMQYGFSNGAAYADLDNDGDLDLVVNNVDTTAFIYQNMTTEYLHRHFLAIHLDGNPPNRFGLGAKILAYADGQLQYFEQMPTRGFQSSITEVIHIGLGKHKKVDSLRVIWPGGATQVLQNIAADETITLHEANAKERYAPAASAANPVFTPLMPPVPFADITYVFDDFSRQPLLYQAYSNCTPAMAIADINKDGLPDLFLGGAEGRPAMIYLQQPDGNFTPAQEPALAGDTHATDVASAFFDANGDGFPDLYVACGGYGNYAPNDAALQDKFYLNDGHGHFIYDRTALPVMHDSKSCVAVADINHDGRPDLFVGGRLVPGAYPMIPKSYVLINDGRGHFKDETDQSAPDLRHIGMVTDAAWVDINRDGWPDLVVVGEWMPISVFINHHGKLFNETNRYFPHAYTGLWNCLFVGDINHDGRPDILVGNLGLNTQLHASDANPLLMVYADFDHNGTMDPILCNPVQHVSYPFPTRDELLLQIPSLRKKFPDYASYANATLSDIFTPTQLKEADTLSANTVETMCFLNDGKKFIPVDLPIQAQFSPVYRIVPVTDHKTGNTDLLLLGNQTEMALRLGRCDANEGVFLKNDGKGHFTYVPSYQSGLHVHGNIRAAEWIKAGQQQILLIGAYRMPLQAYQLNE